MTAPRGAARSLARQARAMAAGVAMLGCGAGETGMLSADPIAGDDVVTRDSTSDWTGHDASASDMDSEEPGPDDDATDAGAGDDATDANIDDDAPASYLAAESVIRTSCAFIRCHGGAVQGGAGLWFGQTSSIRGPLVNVPACEYDKMMRVKPGDVASSWMMIKLGAPQDPQTHFISFSPQSGWVPNSCPGLIPTDGGGQFGYRMPETGMYQLDPDSLAKLVAWIEAGAPGPN
jgi:hypothetical protein